MCVSLCTINLINIVERKLKWNRINSCSALVSIQCVRVASCLHFRPCLQLPDPDFPYQPVLKGRSTMSTQLEKKKSSYCFLRWGLQPGWMCTSDCENISLLKEPQSFHIKNSVVTMHLMTLQSAFLNPCIYFFFPLCCWHIFSAVLETQTC